MNNVDIDFENHIVEIEQIYALYNGEKFDRFFLTLTVNGAIFFNQAFLTARSRTLFYKFLKQGK